MSIKLAVAGRPPIELYDESITLGSDPSCTVAFPENSGVKPKHAVIRMIAGRWLIEVREAEAVFVGGPDPKRMNWLNPGDVIRLTEDGTDITFQPRDDQPLSPPPRASVSQTPHASVSSAPHASVSPAPRAAPIPPPRVSPLPPLPPLHDSDVILPPDSSPSLPVTRPAKPPSSTTIRIPKSSSSATIPTSKAPSSATIRTVKSSEGSAAPTKGAKLQRGSGQMSTTNSDADDVDANAPTLQRMSSWDDSFEDDGRLTPEQAEMRWIMMVVGRAVGAGLVVLVVWITISSIWKALKPSQYDPLSSSTSAPVQASTTPTPPPRPPIANPAPSSTRQTPATDRDSQPSKPKVEKQKPREEAMVDEIAEPKSTDPETSAPAKTPKNRPEPEKPVLEESPAVKAESASGSPAVQAVQEGIYAVMMEDSDKSKRIQVGTAWATSRRYLVTSATVVTAIQEHQEQGMTAYVVQFLTDKQFRIKNVRFHDSYRKAGESAEEAREKRDETRFAADRANQLRFDLGVLDVGRMERLPHRLSMHTDPIDDSKESVFIMVGFPYQDQDGSDSATLDENSLKERRCKKPPIGTPPQNKDMELTIQFAADSNGRNWSGSPVLNKDHKVIGVFSQLPQPKTTNGKPVKAERGVAWIGRLQEFASDVE